MDPPIDQIHLNFNAAGLAVLNVVLGFVMFGVALDMRPADFRRALATPKAGLIGLGAQFFLLPALTYVLVLVIDPWPSMALGMILIASCPGGNVSNFMTHFARGSTALSVTMSAVSTCAAIVMTPLNLTFWGTLYPPTRAVLRQVALDPKDLFVTVAVILGVPIAAGMWIAARFPNVAAKIRRPMKVFSLLFFAVFVLAALAANFDYFLRYVTHVAGLVFVHNAVALGSGYTAARLAGLVEGDRRAVAIEVGIQNSGLGLVLVFNFFGGLGGMAIVAAWWGIWHIVAGLTVATFWSRRPIPQPAEAAV